MARPRLQWGNPRDSSKCWWNKRPSSALYNTAEGDGQVLFCRMPEIPAHRQHFRGQQAQRVVLLCLCDDWRNKARGLFAIMYHSIVDHICHEAIERNLTFLFVVRRFLGNFCTSTVFSRERWRHLSLIRGWMMATRAFSTWKLFCGSSRNRASNPVQVQKRKPQLHAHLPAMMRRLGFQLDGHEPLPA